jgi:hypothetical protein
MGSSSKLLQIQPKWCWERKPKNNPKPEAKKTKTILHPYIHSFTALHGQTDATD